MFSRQDYDALRARAGIVELRARGRILLTGADRRSYLQGLLTNDIVALDAGTGCYAAFLTAQGRMMSDMRVLELGDVVLLDVPGAAAALVRDRLAQFVFSEDVEVTDASERWAAVGVYGPSSADATAEALIRGRSADELAPAAGLLSAMAPFATTKWDFGGSAVVVARNDDYGVPGFDLYVDAGRASELVALLEEGGGVGVSHLALDALRIEAGVPAFGVDMDENTIPLEAGIEDRAISLAKGCYVGQEIIIRVLHRGHGRVARRLVGLTMNPGGPAPAHGDRVTRDGRDVGVVTSGTVSPALGRPVALAYVHRDSAEPDTAVSIARDGAAVEATVSRLPFIPPASG